ncbi:hypothetical protein GLYMA_13G031901v4 [Glycine max]|nr:hypothetical protein GLYMA_13G031901v4 [Glycine max]KAH1099598.1 hypothetical protein GYH30_034983 [Glycine max]
MMMLYIVLVKLSLLWSKATSENVLVYFCFKNLKSRLWRFIY